MKIIDLVESKVHKIGNLTISKSVYRRLSKLVDNDDLSGAAQLLADTEKISKQEAHVIVKAYFDSESGKPKIKEK